MNTPRQTRLAHAFVAVLTALAAGCAPEIPGGEAGARYGPPTFKDDAPANAPAPGDFPRRFLDREGREVDLADYRHRSRVVLVVLRGMPRSEGGGFCPECLAQAGSLMAHRDAFAGRGAEVLVVFPGPAERVGEFVQRSRLGSAGEPPAWYTVLLDPDLAACGRLGIRADLAKPSSYVLDRDGDVIYAYVGETSTDRPSVAALLAQLDRAR